MAITPISGAPIPVAAPAPVAPTTAATPAGKTDAVAGERFGSALAQGIEQLQGLQTNADALAQKAATGDLTDVHDFMIASTQASVATSLTVAMRNKAVEAFTEIMRMPV